jgi:hypothetical protein
MIWPVTAYVVLDEHDKQQAGLTVHSRHATEWAADISARLPAATECHSSDPSQQTIMSLMTESCQWQAAALALGEPTELAAQVSVAGQRGMCETQRFPAVSDTTMTTTKRQLQCACNSSLGCFEHARFAEARCRLLLPATARQSSYDDASLLGAPSELVC